MVLAIKPSFVYKLFTGSVNLGCGQSHAVDGVVVVMLPLEAF